MSDDTAAADRIRQFLPAPSTTFSTLDDVEALTYAEKLIQFVPGVSNAFSVFDKIATCAVNNGVVAARAYIANDYSSAAAMVMVSGTQVNNVAAIAAKCFINDVIGGGETPGGWAPCAEFYRFTPTLAGILDSYYVMTVSTSAQCAGLAEGHQQYSPTQGWF